MEPDEEEAAEIPASAIPVFARCVQALSDQDYESGKALMWTRALACWTGIIEGSRFESLVGKHVFEFLCADDTGRVPLISFVTHVVSDPRRLL